MFIKYHIVGEDDKYAIQLNDFVEFNQFIQDYSDILLTLDCSKCGLSQFPDLSRAQNLINLAIDNNQISQLPDLSSLQKLEGLFCSNNELTQLPNLPKNLSMLSCSKNKLINLPHLPNLSYLHCGNNQLTQLPDLPLTSLIELYCYENQISQLPNLPQSLERFHCQDNQINYIDTYDFSSIKDFNISNQSQNILYFPPIII